MISLVRRPWITLLVVCFGTLVAGIGQITLFEPDEPRFAEATRQMFLRGDFLTPWFNGTPRFEKPILLYWAQAAGVLVFGDSELAARLPSALAGCGIALLTYILGRRALGEGAALFGALSLATSFRFVSYARQGLTDVPVLFFIVLTLVLWHRALADGGGRGAAVWGWIALGLGVLTKGPVALLPLVVWLSYLAVTRQLSAGIRALSPAPGIVAATAVVLPWNLYMWHTHGRLWLDFALGYEVLTRVTTEGVFAPGRAPWWYVQVWLGDAAPWSIFFFAGLMTLATSWRSRGLAERRLLVLAVVWFTAVLVVFSLSRNKIAHYILPLYPAQALVVGWFSIVRSPATRPSGPSPGRYRSEPPPLRCLRSAQSSRPFCSERSAFRGGATRYSRRWRSRAAGLPRSSAECAASGAARCGQ